MYELSKFSNKKRIDKNREEIEFEKQKDELTFAPKITKLSQNLNVETVLNRRGVEENIERYKQARKVIDLLKIEPKMHRVCKE